MPTYNSPRDALLAQREVLVNAIEVLERYLVTVEYNIDRRGVGWQHVGLAAHVIDAIKRADLTLNTPGEDASVALPATEGQWFADIDRDGTLRGWREMFSDSDGRLFSVPGSSRYIANPPSE